MTYLTLRVSSTGEVLGDKIGLAKNLWQRFLGLMGTSHLPLGGGMLFPRTNAVHSYFMRYPIQLAFLDKEGIVLTVSILQPWRIGPIVRQAHYVLELGTNSSAKALQVGDRLVWEATKVELAES